MDTGPPVGQAVRRAAVGLDAMKAMIVAEVDSGRLAEEAAVDALGAALKVLEAATAYHLD